MSFSFSLQSQFEIPAECQPVTIETPSGIVLEVRSPDFQVAQKTCEQIAKVIDTSEHPVPAAQLATQQAINLANQGGQALSCRMSLEMI